MRGQAGFQPGNLAPPGNYDGIKSAPGGPKALARHELGHRKHHLTKSPRSRADVTHRRSAQGRSPRPTSVYKSMVPVIRHLLQGSRLAIFGTSDGSLAAAPTSHHVQLRSCPESTRARGSGTALPAQPTLPRSSRTTNPQATSSMILRPLGMAAREKADPAKTRLAVLAVAEW